MQQIKIVETRRVNSFYIVLGKIEVKGLKKPLFSMGIDLDEAGAIEKCKYEALERFHVSNIDLSSIVKAKAFSSSQFITPIKLFSYSNSDKGDDKSICSKEYSSNVLWGWVKGENIRTSKTVYLPSDYVYVGLSRNAIAKKKSIPFMGRTNSSGCAIYKTLKEAEKSALLELLERDHVLLWWFLGLRTKKINIGEAYAKRNLEFNKFFSFVRKRKMRSTILAIDLDFNVSTFVTILNSSKKPYSVFGFGCSLDPVEALAKSQKEAMFIYTFLGTKYFKMYSVKNKYGIASLSDHGMFYASDDRNELFERLISNCDEVNLFDLIKRGSWASVWKRVLKKGNLYEYIYNRASSHIVLRLISDYLLPLNSSFLLRAYRQQRLKYIYSKYGNNSLFRPKNLNSLPHPVY